jgi:hypothetical protein
VAFLLRSFADRPDLFWDEGFAECAPSTFMMIRFWRGSPVRIHENVFPPTVLLMWRTRCRPPFDEAIS